ncbi:MAG: polysaccharide biosynthesis protein [Clostridiales bacterium]|jgi:FlaA1/EpsC-like NDP-sugar epimerase|nr:polysaccharide biosynthesis protein [Eubacteriales bacterium]MDH7566160.1 polysaccharide biosynthesis protein [Clostridiales bacterium]
MLKNKKILVIGGTGTIGQALISRLIEQQPAVIRLFSRDEHKQFLMSRRFAGNNNIRYLIGDVRDKERLRRAMNDIDIVFNLAALKHVPLCEYNPFEAVKTNVLGTQNVIDCALENNAERVIYASSDKAVSPTNTMGATKLLAERLMASAAYSKGNKRTVFASVRFGNVIGSRGSVLPLFRQQIIEKGCVTVTEPEMTRFMMSRRQAVELMLQACEMSQGGEVFVLKMPVVVLKDFAEVVIENVCSEKKLNPGNIKIEKIGLRPGEKMYEELFSEDEMARAVETENMYILPSIYNESVYSHTKKVEKHCCSSRYQKPLDKDEIRNILAE